MDTDAVIQALIPLVEILENLQISYHVGGSVASSLYGESRQTQDVDVVADIQYEHVRTLVKSLENEYYISDDAIHGAIRHQSSFNVIYLALMVK